VLGAVHGSDPDPRSWAEKKAQEDATLGSTVQPYILVIGGGQGGIALGARLRQLGVPAIVADKHDRPGDQWRKRYKSLCLHDPVWYDHLPYLPFPANWPVFAPKDKIGDWLEFYTRDRTPTSARRRSWSARTTPRTTFARRSTRTAST